MKKIKAVLVLLALVVLAAGAWLKVFKSQAEASVSYKEYITHAEKLEAKGIYIDALSNYNSALEYDKDNVDIVMKISEMYLKLGDSAGYISTCDKAISMDAKNPAPYIGKINYYISKSQYPEALKVIAAADKSLGSNKTIEELKRELSTKTVEKYVGYESVSDWYSQNGTSLIPVMSNGKWGLAAKDGTRKVQTRYEYIGVYDEETGVIPCLADGSYYYIDMKGNRRLVGDYEYQFLGSFGNGLAPAERNGKYGYINTSFEEMSFEFDFAGSFANDTAAVKKNGKWALIGSDLNYKTNFDYDDILLDQNGFCSLFDMVVAKKGSNYVMLGTDGKAMSKNTFQDAAMPASDSEYIAVKSGEKWGFADREGNIVIKPQYDAAKSFSKGLAPVEIDDRWGYITASGELVIDTVYFDAGVFSDGGSAPVYNSNSWNFLVLCEYDD